MPPAAANAPPDAPPANGPLSKEARSLRERVQEVHRVALGIEAMDDGQVADALAHLGPLISHVAAHGEAEEHLVYPHMRGVCAPDIAVLVGDHVRINELASAIAGWTRGEGRAELRRLLDEFCDISTAHFVVEGEVCMPVVHGHTALADEQLLFEAVEAEVFEKAVSRLARGQAPAARGGAP